MDFAQSGFIYSEDENMHLFKKLKSIVPFFVFVLYFSGFPLFLEDLHASTVQVNVVQSMERYPAGDSFPVQFRVRIAEGWYIHGPERGKDFLIPTVLSFPATGTIRVEEIDFPAPEKITFEYAKHPVEVFSGEILVKALLILGKETRPGSHMLKGELSYQACSKNSCLPPEMATVSVPLSVIGEGAVSNPINREVFHSETDKNSHTDSSEDFGIGAGMLLTLIGIFLGGWR